MSILNRLSAWVKSFSLENEPGYNPTGFWIHKNGILKGKVVYALMEREAEGEGVVLTCYNSRNDPPVYFNNEEEAIAWLSTRSYAR